MTPQQRDRTMQVFLAQAHGPRLGVDRPGFSRSTGGPCGVA